MAIDRGVETARFLRNGWSYRLVTQYRASLGPSDYKYHERFRQAMRYRSSESTTFADGAKLRPRPFNEVTRGAKLRRCPRKG